MLKTAAIQYANLQIPIIPMCSFDHSGMSKGHILSCRSPGKRPLIKNWQNAGVPSLEQIDNWFERWPTANIGLVLGQKSGIIAIDVDGLFGFDSLARISSGTIPDTWQFSTPGGGMRYLFKIPLGQNYRTSKIRDPELCNQHSELAFLGDGSCTVLPPSRHKNGGSYTWIKTHIYLANQL